MASLFNTKISNTYVGLLKMSDNLILSSSLREISDGSGNGAGVYLNTSGDLKASGILEFGSLKDTGESITISKFVDEADGIANNDNDTSIPTSAAIVDYVASRITLEDLDFSGDSGTGSVDLDSQTFAIVGTANEIETSAGSQQLQIGLPSNVTISSNLQVNGLLKGNNNIVIKDTSDRTMAAFYGGDKSELYFNDSKKLETTSDGATITGGLTATGGSVFTGASFSSNTTFTTSTYSGDLDFADNAKARFGDSQDFKIYHSGSHTIMQDSGTGNLQVMASNYQLLRGDGGEFMMQGIADAEVSLYYDGSKKISTTNTGIDVTGDVIASGDVRVPDGEFLSSGNSNDLTITNTGVEALITNYTGNLTIQNLSDDKDIIFKSDDGTGSVTEYFRLDGGTTEVIYSKKGVFNNGLEASGANITTATITNIQLVTDFKVLNKAQTSYLNFATRDISGSETVYNLTNVGSASLSSNLDIGDSGKLRLGDSQDLLIYHNSANSYIEDVGTGDFYLQTNGNNIFIRNGVTGNSFIAMNTGNDDVSIRYSGSEKLKTTSSGISVTGNIVLTGDTITNNNSYYESKTTGGGSIRLIGIDNNDAIYIGSIDSGADNVYIRSAGTNAISIDGSQNTSFAGSVTIAQDLTVNGTTTTVNTQTLAVEDPLISLAKDNSANSVDIGFYGRYNDGSNRYLGLFADASDSNAFKLFKGTTTEPTTTVDTTSTGYTRANLELASLFIDDYIYHNGDTNNYFGFSANDNFILRTNASTQLFVDSTNTYLYFDGNQKLRTVNTGVAITGGLTVGDATEENPVGINIQDDRGNLSLGLLIHNQNTGTDADAKISFETQGARDISIGIDRSDGNKFKISHSGNLGSNDFLSIDGSGDMILGGRASIGNNGAAGSEVLTLEGNFTSSGNVKLLHAIRQGGAVAVDLNYTDASTDMEFGTSTSHSFSLKTGGTRAMTIANNQKTTFLDDVTIQGTEYINNIQARTSAGIKLGNDDFSGFVQVLDNGQVNLDSGNSEVHLLGSSTLFGKFFTSGSNFYINCPTQDKDIIFSGDDGGSSVTALTLDMSDSGFGIFNYGVKAQFFTSDGGRGFKQDGVAFVHTYSNGSDADAAGDLGSNSVRWRDLYLHGDIEATDSLTIDVTGDLSLDASGNDIRFKVNGVEYGKFKDDSDDFAIFSSIQDKDIIFKGNDGGSTITALTLDMSNGGSAIFADDIDIADNKKINVGDSADLQIYHDGSHSFIDNTKGSTYLRNTGANSAGIIIRNDDAGDIHLDNDFAGNIIFSTSATNRVVVDSSGEVAIKKSIHLGDDSAVLTPAQYSMLIEAPTGTSTNLNMYTLGSSVFNISSDGSKAKIGWGSSAAREVNFFNSGAGSIKVGVGTETPSSVLSVKTLQDSSFDEGIGVIRSNSSQTGYINMVGGAMNINAPSSIPIKFRDGGTSNLEINANGHTVVNNDLNVEGGIYGKSYTQTSAGSVTSIIDTNIAVEAGVWEIFYMGNSNDAGSSVYRSITTGLIIVTVDFTNPNVVNEIRFEQISQTGGGSSNNPLSIAVKILQGGAEYDELNYSTSGQTIRVKITGWNGAANVGTAGQARITRRL